jgi:magnesium transporter
MQGKTLEQTLSDIRAYLEGNDLKGAIHLLEQLRPWDQADIFGDLPPETQSSLLPRLSIEDSADILEALSDEEAADLVERLPAEDLARIVDEMEPDEAADLLGDLPPGRVADVLQEMEDADEVRPLLLHPDETAGGLMTSEFLVLRAKMTAADAIAALREWAPATDSAYYLFVVDRERRLVGVVSLRDLIVADPQRCVAEIMDRQVISVHTGTDQEECARLMQRYDLLALPVVDARGQLAGVITVDDLVDVLQEEATEDLQRFGGSEPLGRPYLSVGVLSNVNKRVWWLLLLFVTETFTGTVLRHFEHQLSEAVALAFFVPLLIGTGGNAGSQTTSSVIRAIALGDIKLRDGLRVLLHEMSTGVLLGAAMAVFAYLRALTWGSSPDLGLAVGVSIFGIVVWANVVGALLPVLATRLRIDPTVVSGPLMSTLVDATGLFLYFTIAGGILGL